MRTGDTEPGVMEVDAMPMGKAGVCEAIQVSVAYFPGLII
jgi:hypothetical protein